METAGSDSDVTSVVIAVVDAPESDAITGAVLAVVDGAVLAVVDGAVLAVVDALLAAVELEHETQCAQQAKCRHCGRTFNGNRGACISHEKACNGEPWLPNAVKVKAPSPKVQCRHCGRTFPGNNRGACISHERACKGEPWQPKPARERDPSRKGEKATRRATAELMDSVGFAMQWGGGEVPTGEPSTDSGDAPAGEARTLPKWARASRSRSMLAPSAGGRGDGGRDDDTSVNVGESYQATVPPWLEEGSAAATATEEEEEGEEQEPLSWLEVEVSIARSTAARLTAAAFGGEDEVRAGFAPPADEMGGGGWRSSLLDDDGEAAAAAAAAPAPAAAAPIVCAKCGRSFGNRGARAVHEGRCQGADAAGGAAGGGSPRKRRQAGPQDLTCAFCSRAFGNMGAKVTHVRVCPKRPTHAAAAADASDAAPARKRSKTPEPQHIAAAAAAAAAAEVDDDVYTVDRLVATRVVSAGGGRRRRQFRVRWEGWSEEHDTWEDEAHILDEQLIDELKRAVGGW